MNWFFQLLTNEYGISDRLLVLIFVIVLTSIGGVVFIRLIDSLNGKTKLNSKDSILFFMVFLWIFLYLMVESSFAIPSNIVKYGSSEQVNKFNYCINMYNNLQNEKVNQISNVVDLMEWCKSKDIELLNQNALKQQIGNIQSDIQKLNNH